MICTGSTLFSRSQSRSKTRRMRKIAGMRCFSTSSSRKFSTVGSTSTSAFFSPSSFSVVEK